ncbi:putative T7SS-secreted protein [Streptomyces sp. NPDC004250]|uniref:putative T7SS-secreted protein n=1 Tax=Streptomyces sp. NPDC004250 TaxID=3364692 RepID=UPI0036A6FC9B
MSHRPTDWHVLDLESDPTPGDPQRIRKLAGTLHDFADDVGDVLRDLKGIAKEEEILSWAGKTAAVFAEEFGDAPKKLRKLKKSYNLAGDALTTFWPDLQDAQDKADKALRDGRKAREELTTAQTALTGADDWVRRATEKTDSYDPAKNGGKDVPKPDEADVRRATRDAQHAKARQAAAERNVESAQTALDAAKKLAGQAKGLREDAARRTVTKLQEASDAGIPNRHWWEEIGDWVTDNWDEIVTICKWVVTIVGIIVMIVGGPLGWLVFAAALVVMADTIRKVIKGEAGWGDLLWAALDCIPATKGFTSLAKLGKLWKAGGLKALGAGFMGGIGGGLKGLGNGIRSGSANVVSVVKGLAGRGKNPLSFKIQPFKDGRPGMLLFKPGDPLLKSMNRVKSNGSFDVGIHGSPNSVGYQVKDGAAHLSENWHNFNHREVASLMRAHGWNGEPVRLLSCQTGMKSDGFAQNLANTLGVKVEAPNDFLWVWPHGRTAVAPFNDAGTAIHPTSRGAFEIFHPNGGA